MSEKIKQEITAVSKSGALTQRMNDRFAGPLRRAAGQGLDIIFPPQPLWPHITGPLASHVHFIDAPLCSACGLPFPYDMGADVLCGNCTAHAPKFDRARAAFIYDAVSRQPILSLKHGGQTHGLPIFAQQLKRAGRALFSGADMLVPVPLHPRRLRARRFNQAALLALALSRITQIDVDTRSLSRVKATDSQGGKTAAGRRRNMQGAFRVDEAYKANIKGQNLILIDDVMTTGATAEACAGVLKRAGAARVDVLTLARTVQDLSQEGGEFTVDTFL